MVILYAVVALAVVFAIAAVVIGREARRLDATTPNPTFDMDEAVEWVADHLPFEVSAELSHDDVRRIIDWNLEFFRLKGVSGNGHGATGEGPVVVGGAETVDYVLARAQAVGVDYTAPQVHAVLDAQMSYLEAIGAIGPEVDPGPDAGGD
ncbi:MAG TPA: hypothetical protein VGO92_11455 [Acidimicrobiales bacterium]|jgi:hypothetical protein|nr:hypothetical protein [Acidimicrobiales bacterium]